jgi:hypothetical protein
MQDSGQETTDFPGSGQAQILRSEIYRAWICGAVAISKSQVIWAFYLAAEILGLFKACE